jgi:hypothetical protein
MAEFLFRVVKRLHLKGCFNATVYAYDGYNRFVLKFFIGLGKHMLPEDLMDERKWRGLKPKDVCWTSVLETPDFVFIPYGYHFYKNKPESEKEEKGLVLYNKKEKEDEAVKITPAGGFNDDLFGDLFSDQLQPIGIHLQYWFRHPT